MDASSLWEIQVDLSWLKGPILIHFLVFPKASLTSEFVQFMAMEVSLAIGVLNNSNTLSVKALSSAAAALLARGLL